MRRSIAEQANSSVDNLSDWGQERSNLEFFAKALRALRRRGASAGEFVIGLVGSRDLPGISLRRAQAVLRDDRRPSYWSHAFVITADWDGKSPVAELPLAEVPFHPRSGEFPEPARNAVLRSTQLRHYADARVDANLALFSLCLPQAAAVAASARRRGGSKPFCALDEERRKVLRAALADPNLDRDRFDFWRELAIWQQYFWSGEQTPNPSAAGHPLPAASFIEYLFEQIGVDLTPSASALNSAPEHLWTSFRWWLQAEVQAERGLDATEVCGCFLIRDSGASVLPAGTY
jgi:hypothetical protein